MAKIYPSLMGADLLNLQKVIEVLEHDADGFHIDIMDNRFVPNITWGVDTVNAVARISRVPLWVHLMVVDPINWNENLMLPRGTTVTFHLESEKEIPRLIKEIKEKKCRPSIAIKPETSAEQIFPILNAIDHVLLMSVNPGFSGQPFLEATKKKIEQLVAYRDTSGDDFVIGLDGGVTIENIKELAQMGVDEFAISAGIFSQKDPLKALKEIKKII